MRIIRASIFYLNQIVKCYKIFDVYPESEWNRKNLMLKIKKGKVFIAAEKKKVFGVVDIDIFCDCCEICGIAVLKKFRNMGVGKMLINFVEHYAKKKGCHKIWCYSKEKRKAKGFYKKLGYKKEGYLKKQWLKRDYHVFGKILK